MWHSQGYFVAIYLFVGLVAGSQPQYQQPQQEQNGAWNNNKEYRYNLWTRTVAAIPDLKNQWVGVISHGKLTIRPESNDVLIGKLNNVEYAQVDHELPTGWNEFIPENKLQFRASQSNEKPFEVRLRNGAIHSIAVDKSMTNNDLNQLKAALSQLQVDTRAQNVIKCKHNQFSEDGDNSQAVYKVMEPTITGKCETLYDISPLPEYLIQSHPQWAPIPELKGNGMHYKIVKTKNYNNCEQRLGYHFGMYGANDWTPNTNTMGEAVSKSAVSNVIVSGKFDDYTIQSSVTINQVIAKPGQNDQKNAQVVSVVNLTLDTVQESQQRPLVRPQQLIDVGNLIYTYDLPSDAKNQARQVGDSSEESSEFNGNHVHQQKNPSRPRRSLSLSDEDEDREILRELNAKKHGNKFQSGEYALTQTEKYIRRHGGRSSESESDSDSSSSESDLDSVERAQFHQPKPTLEKAPENPLLSLFIGNRGQSIKNAQQINVVEVAKKLAEEIGNDLQQPNDLPQMNTLAKFNILSDLIRTMDAKQIELVTEQLYMPESNDDDEDVYMRSEENDKFTRKYNEQSVVRSAAWKTFRDAVTDAGTGPAITKTMMWIQQRKVRGEDAVQLVAAWPKTIREPTDEMQRAFFAFATSDQIRQQDDVYVTALLALTRFLNMAQVNNRTAHLNYPVNSFGRLADRNSRIVVDEVIPYLSKQLSDAVEKGDAPNVLVYVRALGNLGHSAVLSVFEPYLEGKVIVSDFQRLAMVIALDNYKLSYPKSARSVFYKIYQNAGERHELRVAAVFELILTQPDAAMLQRMAEQTIEEPNPHVRAAVVSALETAAYLKAPQWAELAANAKAAIKLLPKEKLGLQYSRTDLRDYVANELNAMYGYQLSWIVGEDALLPSGLFLRTEKNLGGFKHRSEYQAMVSSIERLTSVLSGQYDTSNLHGSSNKNDKKNNASKWSTEKIAQMLNIQMNEAEQMEGQIMFTFMNSKRFFTFDNHTLDRLPRHVRKMAAKLQKGYAFNYTKFYNAEATTISFPLETGFPFVLNKHVPTLIQFGGKIRANSSPNLAEGSTNEIQVPKTIDATADIDIVYSTVIEATVGFINPANHQRYEAGYAQKAQVYAPIRMSADIDFYNRKFHTEIRPLEPTKRVQVLHMSSWPYTARYDILSLRPIAESKDTKLIHTRPSRPIDFTFGDRTTGFAFTVQGKHEKNAADIAAAWNSFSNLNMQSPWSFAQSLSTPEVFEFNVNFEPERSTTDSAKFKFTYDAETNIEGSTKQDDWKHPRARNTNNKENMAIPSTSVENNGKERRRELMRNVVAGIGSADAQVMEIAVEFNGKGEKKAEYVATVATGKSLVDEKSRFLIVLNRNNAVKQSSAPKSGQVCIHYEFKYNNAPEMNFNDALNQASESKANLYVTYGDKCASNSAAHIFATMKLQQTDELKQYLRASPLAKLCLAQMQNGNNQMPACQRITQKANTIDLAKIEVNFEKLPKWMRQTVYDLYAFTRHIVFPQLSEDINHQGKNDLVDINVRLMPNMKVANMTIYTPNMLIQMEHSRVPKLVRLTMNQRFSVWETVQRNALNYQDTCVIDENQLNTFDNRTINHYLGKTWHLAMHTVQPELSNENMSNNNARRYRQIKNEKMSILVRDSEEQGEKKQHPLHKDIMIVIGQSEGKDVTVELRPPTSKSDKLNAPRMQINGNDEYPTIDNVVVLRTDDSAQQPLLRAYVTPEGVIRLIVRNGQLKIVYDGQRVKMQADSSFRKNVRGICGTYTGQKDTDLKSPKNCILRHDKDFVASWALIDESSQGPAQQRQREANKAICFPENILLGNVISEQEAGRKQVHLLGKINNKQSWPRKSASSSSSESTSDESSEPQTSSDMCEAKREIIVHVSEGKLCFSKRLLPTCPKGCKAKSTVVRDIEVHCRPENDTAAQTYHKLIKNGQSPDMRKYETSDTVQFAVPTKCVRA